MTVVVRISKLVAGPGKTLIDLTLGVTGQPGGHLHLTISYLNSAVGSLVLGRSGELDGSGGGGEGEEFHCEIFLFIIKMMIGRLLRQKSFL